MKTNIQLPSEFVQMLNGNKREERCYIDTEYQCPQIYYRCERNTGGSGVFLEFHVDTYANHRDELQNKMRLFVEKNCREYYLKGYYRDVGICCRRPSLTLQDLEDDFASLSAAVAAAFAEKDDKTSCPFDGVSVTVFPMLDLPAMLSLKDTAARVTDSNFVLPAVQRGKVWNAARCATLWDSIMRGFSIGALSVQPSKDCGKYDLLDGQQRTTAICLGYDDLLADGNDVLWIDLMPTKTDECEFYFYVTTQAQPWGYGRSSDEMRNVKLSMHEIREILDAAEWPQKSRKPTPQQLWPKRANCPVPFALLRHFIEQRIEQHIALDSLNDFVKEARNKKLGNWTKAIEQYDPSANRKTDLKIINAVKGLCKYRVQVLDAGNVSEIDVALYFRRIGKGGVVPSNEEMAYSVLKSKIGSNFREGIEGIVERYGLDIPSRVASLAIRYCLSDDTTIFAGSIMEKIAGNAAKMETVDRIVDFVRLRPADESNNSDGGSSFSKLVDDVNGQLECEGFTNWHITRYCQKHNGDVYLFLMLLKSDVVRIDMNGATLGGIAELLTWYAPNPMYVIRKIIARKSLAKGLAEAMRESHYGSARMTYPQSTTLLQPMHQVLLTDGLKQENDIGSLKTKWPDAAALVSVGYGNEASYSKLIFACNRNLVDKDGKSDALFKYNRSLGIWAEENCPWDYDHILPHSWIDELPRARRDTYSWLVNSIGNLAPIEFSVNRQLSNDERNERYPLVAEQDHERVEEAQIRCCVKSADGSMCVGGNIASMAKFRSGDISARTDFCKATVERFAYVYGLWYERNGFAGIFAFADDCPVSKRKQMILDLWHKLQEQDEKAGERKIIVYYYDWNETRREFAISENFDCMDWFIWSWISVVVAYADYEVELSVGLDANSELGVVANDRLKKNIALPPEERLDEAGYWLFHRNNPDLSDVPDLIAKWSCALGHGQCN